PQNRGIGAPTDGVRTVERLHRDGRTVASGDTKNPAFCICGAFKRLKGLEPSTFCMATEIIEMILLENSCKTIGFDRAESD
ncbi:MAG: hypothetical protein ACYDHH_29680, partial [Solirubrobacteraceae bacterium]